MKWVVYETDTGFLYIETKAPHNARHKVVSIHETEKEAQTAMLLSAKMWHDKQNEIHNSDHDPVFPLPLYPHIGER